VAAATNRYFEAKPAGEIDGVKDIGHAATFDDQRRTFVDEAVVDLAGFLVPRINWPQELSAEGGGELGYGTVNGCDRRHGTLPW